LSTRGYPTDGFEISSERRRIAEAVCGKRIFETNLLAEQLNHGSVYRVVTLFQVLEHISDPVLFLSRLKRLVRPGGDLVIEVPHHGDWLLHEDSAYREFQYQRAHLFYYDETSLGSVLTKAGFSGWDVEFVQRYSITNAFHWIIQHAPQIAAPAHSEVGDRAAIVTAYRKVLVEQRSTDTLLVTVHL